MHLFFISAHPPGPIVRGKTKEEEKRLNEERIRSESDLKRVYIYATRAIQTQDQTNLNRYALVKAGLELYAQHATLFTTYLYEDYPEILRCLRAWNAHDNYEVKRIAQRSYDSFLLGVRENEGGGEKRRMMGLGSQCVEGKQCENSGRTTTCYANFSIFYQRISRENRYTGIRNSRFSNGNTWLWNIRQCKSEHLQSFTRKTLSLGL